MNDIQYLNFINRILIENGIIAVCLIALTTYLYIKRNAVYHTAFLITMQQIINFTTLPIIFIYEFGYKYCYLFWTTIATCVVIRIFFLIHSGKIKSTSTEVNIIALLLFIMLCDMARYIDKFAFSYAEFSIAFDYISIAANYLIYAVLLLPTLPKIVNKYPLFTMIDKVLNYNLNLKLSRKV